MNISKLVARLLIFPVALAGAQGALAQHEADNAAMPSDNGAEPMEGPVAHNPQVVAFVDYQYPKADADSDGTVTASEFKEWVRALKVAEMQKSGEPADPAAVNTYTDTALFAADQDRDKALSREELVVFFGG